MLVGRSPWSRPSRQRLLRVGEGQVTLSGPEDDRGAAWEIEVTRPDASEGDVLVAADGSIVKQVEHGVGDGGVAIGVVARGTRTWLPVEHRQESNDSETFGAGHSRSGPTHAGTKASCPLIEQIFRLSYCGRFRGYHVRRSIVMFTVAGLAVVSGCGGSDVDDDRAEARTVVASETRPRNPCQRRGR